MGVNDYGDTGDVLSSPPLGGPGGWAESVAAVLNGSDETVDARVADAINAHSADTTDVHGIPDTADLTTSAELEAYAAARATVGNLLTDNQASGTDTLGDATGFVPHLNCTIVSSDVTAAEGARSLRVTATGTGPIATTSQGLSGVQVVVGQDMTITARVHGGGAVGKIASLGFRWYSVAAALLGTTYSSTFTLTADYQTVSFTASVPAQAAFASWSVRGVGVVAAEFFDVDSLSFHVGAGGNWAMPGTPITGLGTRITRPNVDDRLVEQWNGSAWSVVDYDSGWRDISGLLNNEWTGTLYIRRAGEWVDMWGTLDSTNKTGNTFITMPTGFKGSPARALLGASRNNAWTVLPIYTGDGADFNIITNPTEAVLRITAAYATYGDALPTSLPGTLNAPAPQ